MTERHDSVILHFVVRVFMVPFIFVFGIYVLIHGEASPGGGFQAGAIAAAGIVLARLTLGNDHSENRFPTRLLIWLSSLGLGIYLVAGMIPMLFGGNYLDYSELPVLWFNNVAEHARTARAMGIFIVEIGVFVGVLSTLVILYDYLTLRFQDDD
ncbi:MAG: sodium:proton antiporter [Chloroflexi bacterium]|nr:sodium:proton antiporter [Chloroflexota bacterium]